MDVVKPHPVDTTGCGDGAVLGEYASVYRSRGAAVAAQLFPEIANHLDTGCPTCQEDLVTLQVFLEHESLNEPKSI